MGRRGFEGSAPRGRFEFGSGLASAIQRPVKLRSSQTHVALVRVQVNQQHARHGAARGAPGQGRRAVFGLFGLASSGWCRWVVPACTNSHENPKTRAWLLNTPCGSRFTHPCPERPRFGRRAGWRVEPRRTKPLAARTPRAPAAPPQPPYGKVHVVVGAPTGAVLRVAVVQAPLRPGGGEVAGVAQRALAARGARPVAASRRPGCARAHKVTRKTQTKPLGFGRATCAPVGARRCAMNAPTPRLTAQPRSTARAAPRIVPATCVRCGRWVAGFWEVWRMQADGLGFRRRLSCSGGWEKGREGMARGQTPVKPTIGARTFLSSVPAGSTASGASSITCWGWRGTLRARRPLRVVAGLPPRPSPRKRPRVSSRAPTRAASPPRWPDLAVVAVARRRTPPPPSSTPGCARAARPPLPPSCCCS
jgi:hypothetical protein